MSNFASVDSATRQTQGDSLTAEEILQSGAQATEDAATYATILGDDALMLGQRMRASSPRIVA